MASGHRWERLRLWLADAAGVRVDVSRMAFSDAIFADLAPALERAFKMMAALEAGAIANPDEQRMVGHYWLRDPDRAPHPDIAREIRTTLARVKRFARDVHVRRVKPRRARAFSRLLVIGIGGSALGPQFVARALGDPARDRLQPVFFDNTDPDGFDRVLASLGSAIRETLAVVISKSGGTPETRNGMLEAERAWRAAGLDLGAHAVAITQDGSQLDRYAVEHEWLARFPMWDWIGGRTSETSAVGLLPAALQGFDVDALLAGAREMDGATRVRVARSNPAALLAVMWHHAGQGRGAKDMVVLPYKDRLELLSRYLQQLVMESLGKERDLDGRTVHQGIAVYGNKGSTDQHAYVQQLREGVDNFFVTFIEVLRDRQGRSMEVEPGVTSGDYLSGFLQGTRRALQDAGRESITITIPDVTPATIGKLIALFERAVGLYAGIVNINAYHQPGVEAGKRAAAAVLEVQRSVVAFLRGHRGKPFDVEAIAQGAGVPDDAETVFAIVEHLAANPDRRIGRRARAAAPLGAVYFAR
jgi:glucose-6-phosphate isomerase